MKKIVSIGLILSVITLLSCKEKKEEKPGTRTYRESNLRETLGSLVLDEINQKIFMAAKDGKIDAYLNNNLKKNEILKPSEVGKKGETSEVVSIAPNPENPDYTFDSVIANPFDPKKLNFSFVSEMWNYNADNNTYTGSIFAYGPGFHWIISGVDLKNQPLFWVKFEDLSKVLSKDELQLLKKGISKTFFEAEFN